MSEIQINKFEAQSFMGIDSSNPVLIDFSSSRKGQNVVKLTGDQGTRKTSTMTALMYLLGAAFNIDQKNFKNLNDDTIDVSVEFEYGDSKYLAEVTGSRFSLKTFLNGKWRPESQPKEMIRKMVGPLGVSPMFLKELDGKKQIKWFKETFGTDEEASKKEQNLIKSIDELFDNRREVNRVIKSLKGALDSNDLYANYAKSEERFKKPISADKEKKKLEELADKAKEYEKASDGHARLVESHKETVSDIADLEKQLAEAKAKEKELAKRIEDGKKWLGENKSIVAEYEKANNEWVNISKTLAEYQQWKEILAKEKEYNESVEASQEADAKLDKLRTDLLKLTKKYLPEIEGLEIKIKTSMTDEEEGIYYNGKTLAMLSESELWALFTQIWEAKNVRFVFCENANSLGSDAVGVLNKLAKEGAIIFASEMVRKQKTMEFSIQTKLD